MPFGIKHLLRNFTRMKINSLMDNSNTCLAAFRKKNVQFFVFFFCENLLENANQSKNVILKNVPYV